MYTSQWGHVFERPPSTTQPCIDTLAAQPTYETPSTVLSRVSSSNPRVPQQQAYYYYQHENSPSVMEQIECRAPLGFAIKEPEVHHNTYATPAYEYETSKRGKQSRKKPRREGDLIRVGHDGGSGMIYYFQERKLNQVDDHTALYEPVYMKRVDASWPDVPTSRRRPQYKDQSTQTDPVTMTIEEMYAAVIAHQAQQEIVDSSTQDSSGWTGGSGVEVDALIGRSSDELVYPSAELGGYQVDLNMNAANSGSNYSFPLPNAGGFQGSTWSGTSGEGDMTTMGNDFDSLDPAAVMEMAILEGWADMDFGLLGAGTEVEAETTAQRERASLAELGYPIEKNPSTVNPFHIAYDAKSETLSPSPPVDEKARSARRHKQPPGAGWQLPRGTNLPEEAGPPASSRYENTSLAENVKNKRRYSRAVKEKAPPKPKKEKKKTEPKISKRATKK